MYRWESLWTVFFDKHGCQSLTQKHSHVLFSKIFTVIFLTEIYMSLRRQFQILLIYVLGGLEVGAGVEAQKESSELFEKKK